MPQMNFQGAITTQGNTTINGNVTVNGNDAPPATWGACGNTAPTVAGAAISPTTTATVNGSVSLSGSPPVLTTPTAGDTNTYFTYGSSTYQSLAAAATYTYAAGTLLNGVGPLVVGGVCQASVSPPNWGEPTHAAPPATPCESYFPVIHALGDLKITTGRGQGILLVDGDLTIAGNFAFDGAVIVRGGLKMTGTGNKIVGAVMSASVNVDDNVALAGNTSLLYSSCALISALSAAAAGVTRRAELLLEDRTTLSLGVARQQLVIEGVATDPKHPVLAELAARLHRHHLGAVTFRRGVETAEVASVLKTLAVDAERSGQPLRLGAPGRLRARAHGQLHPLTYERLAVVEEDAPASQRRARAAP